MRVSSSLLYDSTVSEMTNLQSRLINTQRQIASGQKYVNASEDPVAASRILDLSQLDAMNTQYAENRVRATDALSFAEGTLQSMTEMLVRLRTDSISGQSVINDPRARDSLALDFKGRLQALIGLANTTDEAGNYMFAGFQTSIEPFSDTPAGVAYMGDDGQRHIHVSSSRKMPVTYPGSELFMRIKTGNGDFETIPSSSNTGGAYTSIGAVVDASAFTTDSYQVSFAVDAATGQRSYTVTNQTSGVVVAGNINFSGGQKLSFGGMEFVVHGNPNNGDSFTVSPSVNESLFTTVNKLIDTLDSGINIHSGLQRARDQIDRIVDNVLNVRASVGLGLNEVEHLDDAGTDYDLQFKQSLSKLRDTDYAQAVSDLQQQKVSLEAAQLSFSKISNLSLFNYIG